MRRPEFRWPIELDRFDVADYVAQVGRYGRAGLPADVRQSLQPLLAATTVAACDRWRTTGHSAVLGLAHTVAHCETSMITDPLPSYPIYANLPVLEQCIGLAGMGGVQDAPASVLWRAIDTVIVDLQARFSGPMAVPAEAMHARHDHRAEQLARLRELVPAGLRGEALLPTGPPPTHLANYAADGHYLALLHLTALPQSTVPEEFLLIRGIQLCELAFWGAHFRVRDALSVLNAKIDSAIRGAAAPHDAAFQLTQAIDFANVFVPTLHLVRTIPPIEFARFAATAEAAIAIDSRSYQLLESHVYGVLPEKREMLARMPHARAALKYDRPSFRPLVCYADHSAVGDLVHRLEALLFAWKKYHERRLAAGGYLQEPEVSGSKKGPSYLSAQRPPRPRRGRKPAPAPTGPAGD